MWSVQCQNPGYWLDPPGVWIEDERKRIILDSRRSRGLYVIPEARRKIEAVPEMERALASILVLIQWGIEEEDREAIKGHCRSALAKAWGAGANSEMILACLRGFAPLRETVGKEDVHHRNAEATEEKDHAKAQRREGGGS
jgi:hypothetical protein